MANPVGQPIGFCDNHDLCGDQLIRPLTKFHERLFRPCDQIPDGSVALEVIVKISLAIVAPLAYLILSIVAAVGLIIKSISCCASGANPNPHQQTIDELVQEVRRRVAAGGENPQAILEQNPEWPVEHPARVWLEQDIQRTQDRQRREREEGLNAEIEYARNHITGGGDPQSLLTAGFSQLPPNNSARVLLEEEVRRRQEATRNTQAQIRIPQQQQSNLPIVTSQSTSQVSRQPKKAQKQSSPAVGMISSQEEKVQLARVMMDQKMSPLDIVRDLRLEHSDQAWGIVFPEIAQEQRQNQIAQRPAPINRNQSQGVIEPLIIGRVEFDKLQQYNFPVKENREAVHCSFNSAEAVLTIAKFFDELITKWPNKNNEQGFYEVVVKRILQGGYNEFNTIKGNLPVANRQNQEIQGRVLAIEDLSKYTQVYAKLQIPKRLTRLTVKRDEVLDFIDTKLFNGLPNANSKRFALIEGDGQSIAVVVIDQECAFLYDPHKSQFQVVGRRELMEYLNAYAPPLEDMGELGGMLDEPMFQEVKYHLGEIELPR